jgi:hypothetical protein
LAGIGREGLYIAPLALGVKRIESETALPRPTQARNDNEFVAGDIDIQVFKIMLARTAYDDFPLTPRPAVGGNHPNLQQ